MRRLIEKAIKREGALLDAMLETSDDFDLPRFEWNEAELRLNRSPRKFSGRATSRARFSTRPIKSPHYMN
jgi:hypothetical protein